MTDAAKRVVVIGSAHMDFVVKADRLPQRGESVIGEPLSISPGGKAANQAVQFARLGVTANLLSRVGNDAFGRRIEEALRETGVNTSLLSFDVRFPTGASLVMTDGSEYQSVISPGAAGAMTHAEIVAARSVVASADAVVLQLEINPLYVQLAANEAKRAGTRLVLNASPSPGQANGWIENLLHLSDVLIVNRREASELLGDTRQNGNGLADLTRKLQRVTGVETVIVTAGRRGAYAVRGAEKAFVRAFPSRVVDTIGAGDSFLGAAVTGLLEGHSLSTALRMGAAAGALTVQQAGAFDSLPDRSKIQSFLEQHSPIDAHEI